MAVKGKITAIRDFGAFVDVAGIEDSISEIT
jgi:predicted RNA-binding protein with RPS1 domain